MNHPPANSGSVSGVSTGGAAGVLFVISAPSGAGKTSLLQALLARDDRLSLSVSYTTRPPRPGEIEGRHYHFVDAARFAAMLAADAFVEHAQVFGQSYGTAAASLASALGRGADLLLEIDWQGARQVRRRFADAVSIFIAPPAVAVLEQRLRERGQDSAAVIARRMAAARDELSHYHEYDYLVVNDCFDRALDDLCAIVRAERLRQVRQAPRLGELLGALAQ